MGPATQAIDPFSHSFNNYLFSTYSMPGTVLDNRNRAVKESLCLLGVYIPVGRDRK